MILPRIAGTTKRYYFGTGSGTNYVMMSAAKYADVLTRANYDQFGNSLGAGSASWTTFYNQMVPYRLSGSFYQMRAWHFALMYMVTKDTAYATRAIALVDAEVANGYTDERFDQRLYLSFFIKDCAIVYNWLKPLLTSTQKSNYITYMNTLIGELWNPYGIPSGTTWAGWALSDRGNNYHYGHLQATAFAALAMGADNVSPATLYINVDAGNTTGTASYTDWIAFLNDSFTAVNTYLNAYEAGGGWHEGDNYGAYGKYHMMEAFSAWVQAGYTNHFTGMPVVREMAKYYIHNAQPGGAPGESIYNGAMGDVPGGSFLLTGLSRVGMLMLCEGLGALTEAQYMRDWLTNKYPNVASGYRDLYADDFFWDQAGQSSSAFTAMPTQYISTGPGWAGSRTGWGTTDVSVSFVSADRLQTHQHQEQNGFQIFYKGWQTVTNNLWTASLINVNAKFNNVILVDGEEQRYSDGASPPTGEILQYKAGSDYTYVSGDASDAYYTGISGYGTGTTKLLSTNIRELVHCFPNHVVVYDRVAAVNTSQAITYLLNVPNSPTLASPIAYATNGSGRIFQKTILPASPTITTAALTDDSGTGYQVKVKAPATAANYAFLHLLETADSSQGTMNASTSPAVTETVGAKMDGVHIQDAAGQWVVMFSSSTTGVDVSGSIGYALTGVSGAVRHILVNMPPSTAFTVTCGSGANPSVSIAAGSGVTSSAEGVLSFTTTNGTVS